MVKEQKTLGQAIDEVIEALKPLEESTRMTAVRAACEHLGLSLGVAESIVAAVPVSAPSGTSVPAETAARTPVTPQDIRTFREVKGPKNAIEMACLVAYYLEYMAQPADRKTAVTKADLDKYFKQAGQKLPKKIDQVLVDAKSAGYFDSVSRGKYKLNPVGDNLVVHTLPKTGK